MHKAFKFRIYPNKDQEILFSKHFGCTRFVYNYFLEKRTAFFAANKNSKKRSLSYFETQSMLVAMKKEEQYSWLTEVNSQSLLMGIRNLDNAFTKFFRNQNDYPTFKSKANNHKSFQIPQHTKITGNKLFIPKDKQGIKIKLHRQLPVDGKIKTITISKTPSNKYYASILVDIPQELPTKQELSQDKTIGIDLGLKEFVITSEGKKYENPKFYRSSEKRLAILSKRHSRKLKGGKNREKSRVRLAKYHEYVANQRNDYQHKVSYDLVVKNQATTVMIENLNVGGMLKNHCLAKSISDVGWGGFVTKLAYKSDWCGKNLHKIGRFEPSSKTCSSCGKINNELTLKDREWECSCGVVHDRDVNAAKNIRQFGMLSYYSGQELPEEPVESLTLVGAAKQEASSFRVR